MSNIMFQKNEHVAKIIINREDVRNAINEPTMEELHQVLNEIEQDDSIRVVILTGTGEKAFISGGDIKEFEQLTTISDAKKMAERMRRVLNRIEQLPVPTIAAINGHALGGGCETALACDFRVSVDEASLGFLQINMGIITGWGSGPRLEQLIGRSKATQLLMLGERISAKEAQNIGLVHDVVDRDNFIETVNQLAEKLSSKPPLALKGFKLAMNQWRDMPFSPSQIMETEIFSELWVSEDHFEAARAVLEKRKPTFYGK
ncbi:enoyl-CoA hydratase/isomerase family protein [Anaerobacillus sp. MEB173]|uniref:enoyl-CoA hydratase/isomerase family protein n=1 Tax=Anaerobacillus sp. MEB173 TaxID=3383345 RepID=UPI003F8FB2B0